MSGLYDSGFQDGLRAAVTLMRAGCGPDDLAAVLDEDSGVQDPAAYQAHLSERRKILRTDCLAVSAGAEAMTD